MASLIFRTTVTSICFVLLIFLSLIPIVLARKCIKIDKCKCKMDDGSGIIDLSDLDNPNGKPRFPSIPGQNTKLFTYLFNPCTPLKFTSGNEKECTGSNLCQREVKTGGKYYPCDASDPDFIVDKSNHVVMTFKSKFFQGHSRNSSITLNCGEKDKKGSFGKGVFEEESGGKSKYLATLSAKSACPVVSSGSSSSLSIGSILLIIFFPLVLLYLIVGVLFNIYVRHEQSMPDVLPNHTFWADLPFLVKDGCVFSFGKMKWCCLAVCEKARGQEYTQI